MNDHRHSISFLLVDDDNEDAELFSQAICEIDPLITVYHAPNGEHALEMLGKGDFIPSIIFLDINMPKVNGWECLIRLKKNHHTQNIPTIMYSTSRHTDDKIMAEKLGAVDFIVKPNHFSELKDALSRVSSRLLVKK